MNDKQKSKRNFRQSKIWKEFKKRMNEKCGKVDAITLSKLRKGANLHHRNLNEKEYENLREDWFLPCNNLTHKVIHWLWTYYKNDEGIINRLKKEMELMKEINKGAENESGAGKTKRKSRAKEIRADNKMVQSDYRRTENGE